MRKLIHNPQFFYNPNAKDAYFYAYVLNVIEERWPEVESIIMKDPKYACYYAREIIKGRWEEAEPFIIKDPHYAGYYACEVIKDRWEEAETLILNSLWENEYKKYTKWYKILFKKFFKFKITS